MDSPPSPFRLHHGSLLLVFVLFSSICELLAENQLEADVGGIRRRRLLGFKETPGGGNTTFDCSPSGPCVPCQYSEKSEEKYRCSETGYRIPLICVRTGAEASEAKSDKLNRGRSTLGESLNKRNPSSNSNDEKGASSGRILEENTGNHHKNVKSYVTYRSCIPAVNEEKISVLGFEMELQKVGISQGLLSASLESGDFIGHNLLVFRDRGMVLMLGLLLASGSMVFLRRKRTATMPGVGGVRMQTNPRF